VKQKANQKVKACFLAFQKRGESGIPFKGFSFFIEKDVPSVQFEIPRSKNKFKRF